MRYEKHTEANFCFWVGRELAADRHPCWKQLECQLKRAHHPRAMEAPRSSGTDVGVCRARVPAAQRCPWEMTPAAAQAGGPTLSPGRGQSHGSRETSQCLATAWGWTGWKGDGDALSAESGSPVWRLCSRKLRARKQLVQGTAAPQAVMRGLQRMTPENRARRSARSQNLNENCHLAQGQLSPWADRGTRSLILPRALAGASYAFVRFCFLVRT